jgi:hypothetical protein
LRPEKARTLQAIYWTFVDFPQWILQRTACWFTFGTIRSSIVKDLAGNVSGLMARVLKTFFPEHGHSFTRGVTIRNGDESIIVTAAFIGFLTDDKALTEIGGSKGASGNPFSRRPTALTAMHYHGHTMLTHCG